jgi:hypothetical protein
MDGWQWFAAACVGTTVVVHTAEQLNFRGDSASQPAVVSVEESITQPHTPEAEVRLGIEERSKIERAVVTSGQEVPVFTQQFDRPRSMPRSPALYSGMVNPLLP